MSTTIAPTAATSGRVGAGGRGGRTPAGRTPGPATVTRPVACKVAGIRRRQRGHRLPGCPTAAPADRHAFIEGLVKWGRRATEGSRARVEYLRPSGPPFTTIAGGPCSLPDRRHASRRVPPAAPGRSRSAGHRRRRGSTVGRRRRTGDGAAPPGSTPNDWLRRQHLPRPVRPAPVGENGSWACGHRRTIRAGCCSTASPTTRHRERRDTPPRATQAGNSGNVAVSSVAADHGEGPHRPVDVGTVPRDRDPAAEPDADVVRAVFEPDRTRSTTPWKSAATLDVIRGLVAGPQAVDADRVPRQRRDHEPHPVRRRVARPPHVLRLGRPQRRPAAASP